MKGKFTAYRKNGKFSLRLTLNDGEDDFHQEFVYDKLYGYLKDRENNCMKMMYEDDSFEALEWQISRLNEHILKVSLASFDSFASTHNLVY